MDCQDPLSMSIAILQKFGVLPEMYQVGCTKLYFRKGQVGLGVCVFIVFVNFLTLSLAVSVFRITLTI